MSETDCKHQKIMKRTRKKIKNDQNLQSVTVKNEKKRLKMTLKESNKCSKIDVILTYQLFNL